MPIVAGFDLPPTVQMIESANGRVFISMNIRRSIGRAVMICTVK